MSQQNMRKQESKEGPAVSASFGGGEINLYNKWGEEKALRHGLGCQKEPISLPNPRLKVSRLLQGKSSGEMAFLFIYLLFFISQLPKHFCCAHNLAAQMKKKGKCGSALGERVVCVCAGYWCRQTPRSPANLGAAPGGAGICQLDVSHTRSLHMVFDG